jgi:hypothetical protein
MLKDYSTIAEQKTDKKTQSIKDKVTRITHPRPAVGLDLLIKRLHNSVKASIGTEYKSCIRPLQNKVTPSHQDLPRS